MIEIPIQGVRIKLMVISDQIWFHWKGQTYCVPTLVSLKSKIRRGKSASGSDSGKIVAPMPGKITQLRAQVGEVVSLGQVVMVMEAMKMEYTLKSGRGGILKSIFCTVGQSVTADSVLAEIKEVVEQSAEETKTGLNG